MAEEGFILNITAAAAQQQASDAIYAASYAALDKTAEDARALSPKLTGTNAASIAARLRTTVNGITKGTIFTQSGYGGWIEIGTHNTEAHPYIYPAAVKDLPEIIDLVRVRLSR